MVTNTPFDAMDAGRRMGSTLSATSLYRDDFIETEDVTDITLAALESINITGSWYVYQAEWKGMFIVYHPVYGVVGSTLYPVGNPFILGHPVYGILGVGWLGGSATYSNTLFASGYL